jgi:MFS family permease
MELLKRRDFRNLMIGKAMSAIGSNVQQFALSLYVLAISGSASIFASMLAISILPRLLLSPVGGVFGDWFDRKKTIVRLDLLNAFLIGGYGLYFYINGALSIASIYILVVLLEIVEIFFGSAMVAVVPCMIEKEKMMEANSLRSIIMTLANTISPLLASALFSMFGLLSILIVNAISFLVSALMEMRIQIPAFHKKPQNINVKQFKQDFLDGLQVLKGHRILMNIISLGVLLNFSLSPLFSVGMIFIFVELLGASEIQYGFLMTLTSTAMLLSPLLLGKKAKSIPVGNLIVGAFTLVGVLTMMMAYAASSHFTSLFNNNTTPLLTMSILLFAISMLAVIANIAIATLFDTLVPREFLGRVASVRNMGLMAAIPLGQVLFGLAIDTISVSATIAIVGLISLVSIAYFWKSFINQEVATCNTPSIPSRVG